MKSFSQKYNIEYPYIVVATCEYVSPGSPIMIADVRDTDALWYPPAKVFIGIHHTGHMLLGSGVCELINGIWYTRFDEATYLKMRDLKPLDATLKRIIST